jgi:hypothetical protein
MPFRADDLGMNDSATSKLWSPLGLFARLEAVRWPQKPRPRPKTEAISTHQDGHYSHQESNAFRRAVYGSYRGQDECADYFIPPYVITFLNHYTGAASSA